MSKSLLIICRIFFFCGPPHLVAAPARFVCSTQVWGIVIGSAVSEVIAIMNHQEFPQLSWVVPQFHVCVSLPMAE